MVYFKKLILVVVVGLAISATAVAQNTIEYKKPIESIEKVMMSPTNAQMTLSPDRKYIALCSYDLFLKGGGNDEFLNLAGVKFNTVSNMPEGPSCYTSIRFKHTSQDAEEYTFVGLPADLSIVDFKWSPDSHYIALALKEEEGVNLWVLDVQSRKAKRLYEGGMNFSLVDEELFEWIPNENSIVFTAIPERDAGLLKSQELKPIIYENSKDSEPHRTYQGLLKSEYDERLFDYYGTSQLKKVDLKGRVTNLGEKAGVLDFKPSPDGKYIMVHYVRKPYSYEYTVHRFPSDLVLLSNAGKVIEKMKIPKVVRPLGRDAAYNVARSFEWRRDKGAVLTWVMALDEGNPNVVTTERDLLYAWEAPFKDEHKRLYTLSLRYKNTYWINDSLAILEERWRATRVANWLLINPETSKFIDTLAHFNTQSYNGNPGKPMLFKRGNFSSLYYNDSSIFLSKTSLNQQKEVEPYLEKMNLFTKQAKKVWNSEVPNYEYPIAIERNGALESLIIARQSKDTPVNLVRCDLTKNTDITLSYNINNLEIFNEELEEKSLTYFRKDSIRLQSNMIYNKDSLENGHIKGTIVFAYPIDFIDRNSASEVNYYPYNFEAHMSLQKLLALYGYIILDNTSFPVVGTKDDMPNDTYLEQIDMNADAIITAAYETGMIDTAKVAVMGHSYGAFMVANILTHSKLFKTGIAISGAYNRSLTPFGFQREYRNYWEAQDLYHSMSPFQNADQMNNSILLIHGKEDTNPGTHYQQSERYFNALKGLGKTVRFLSLPNETHGLKYLNSYFHVIWEIDNWLNYQLKGDSFLSQNSSSR